MIKDRNIDPKAAIQLSKIMGAGSRIPGEVFYVADTDSAGEAFLRTRVDNNKLFAGTDPFNDAIGQCVTGRGDRIVVMPGFYQLAATIALDKNDIRIEAVGTPEDTMLFGSGSVSSVTASDYDLFTVTGNNNTIDGLGLFTYKNTKAAIKLDDAGGAATAGFNVIKNCYFSPQAADGQAYGVQFAGGSVNWIVNNVFEATKTAGILLTGSVGNPARTLIRGNEFIGTGDQGIHITSANYQTRIIGNYFTPGSQSGYNMTKGIIISAGMNAGDVMYADNIFNLAAADVITDGGSGTVNDKAKLGNYYLA